MNDILKFENRDQLYSNLIEKYGAQKIEEKNDEVNFGNFYVTLSLSNFLLRYVNDRSVLRIDISGKIDPNNWYDLDLIYGVIYYKNKLQQSAFEDDNRTKIEVLNRFIETYLLQIQEWFEQKNYFNNRYMLNKHLREVFDKKFPGARIQ